MRRFSVRHLSCQSAALVAICLSVAVLPAAHAATEATYTVPAFTAAQHEGKPILVYISATWCPTCAKQKPILSELEKAPEFKDLIVYHVDFDSQKDVVRAMGATMQSTLVAFHGTQERGRSTGETDASALKALLEKAAE